MPLKRIKDFDKNYLEAFDGNDIIGFKVYTEVSEEIVGSVKDILLDESGYFRYLVIDFGFLIFNKQVMLPVGRCRVDNEQARVYVLDLNRKQAENFPEYNDRVLVDYDYEEQVRSAASLRSAAPYNRDTYNYEQDPSLYELNDRNHQILKLYQERLMAKKKRDNTGNTALIQQITV